MVVYLGTSQNLYKWQISWISISGLLRRALLEAVHRLQQTHHWSVNSGKLNLFVEQLLHDRIILACSLAVHEN